MFFHLFGQNRIKKAVISDSNSDLIDCYLAIRKDLPELFQYLEGLKKHARDSRYYYEIARKRFNEIKVSGSRKDRTERSALLLYLNKTCFNGLYRVNRKGEFNVPWGDYKNPRICDEENLSEVSSVLNQTGVEIICQDYARVKQQAKKDDFVYFDPPYSPLSRTANFTSYTPGSFGRKSQEQLAEVFRDLSASGARVMLSNSPQVRPLYEGHGYRIETVRAGRAINSDATKRGPVDELLIMNY